jgi:di/tricarboxylate transporter
MIDHDKNVATVLNKLDELKIVDFAKVGLPLTLIVGVVVIALAPLVYKF